MQPEHRKPDNVRPAASDLPSGITAVGHRRPVPCRAPEGSCSEAGYFVSGTAVRLVRLRAPTQSTSAPAAVLHSGTSLITSRPILLQGPSTRGRDATVVLSVCIGPVSRMRWRALAPALSKT